MANLDQKLVETVVKRAQRDATTVVLEGHTRSFIAERYLNLLKTSNKQLDTPFYGQGKKMFELYSSILNEAVDAFRGPGVPEKGTPFPTWDSLPEKMVF